MARLTENDLARIVRRVIVEQNLTGALKSAIKTLPGGGGTPTAKGLKPAIGGGGTPTAKGLKPAIGGGGTQTAGPNFNYNSLRPCTPGEEGKLVKQSTIFALSKGSPFCKIAIT